MPSARNIPRVYVLDGGRRPDSVSSHSESTGRGGELNVAAQFAEILAQRSPNVECRTVAIAVGEFEASGNNLGATLSRWLADARLPQGAAVVGIGQCGFLAAKLQESRADLHVFALNAPAEWSGKTLAGKLPRRFALYSTTHERVGHTENWPRLAESYDVRWAYLRHTVAAMIAAYLNGWEIDEEVERINRRLENGSRPPAVIPMVYLLHGKGGSPAGSVSQFEAVLSKHWPNLRFTRPLLPHNDESAPAGRSVEFLQELRIPEHALLIGLSLGGLVAAGLQEQGRGDLHVICINSPTWADDVRLQQHVANRVAIYSSLDPVIAGRTADWPRIAEAYDFPWLTHETDPHRKYLVRLIDWYLEGRLAIAADRVLDVPRTRQEASEDLPAPESR